jgi:ketosteroid isomerase-like protein
MKEKITRVLLSLYLLSVLAACSSKKEEAPAIDKEKVKMEIQAREDEFAALYNSGELKSIGYYADDAITYYQNRLPLQGKEARTEFLQSDVLSSSNKISFKTNEVFVAKDGIMVLEIGYYTVTDSTGAAINTGNYMSLFEKRDGKYVCLRDMSASDMPVE